MKKVLVTILSLVIVLSVLTGCGGNYGFVASINNDFTGDLNISFGYSEKIINDSVESGSLTDADVEALTKYEANGKTYYGEITKGSYMGALEFNIIAVSATKACNEITKSIIGKEFDARWFSSGAISKKGHPHHPLYLRKDSGLDLFDIEGYIENCI